MKTQEEIIKIAVERAYSDILGFETSCYYSALSRESMERLKGSVFNEDADFSDMKQPLKTDQDVINKMKDYLEFAYEKAINCRSISAERSICHYSAWLWLIGEDDLSKEIKDYSCYGIDSLDKIKTFLKDK